MSKLPRPHMSLSVKLSAALHMLGIDPDNVDWDHEPPLALRVFDPETGEYHPPANDPRYIRPMDREDHRHKTGGDVKQIASKRRTDRALEDKVAKQQARRDQSKLDQETPERPAQRGKLPKGRSLPRKNQDGQRTATKPLSKRVEVMR